MVIFQPALCPYDIVRSTIKSSRNKLFDNYNYDQKGDRALSEKSLAQDPSLPLLSETSNHRREKLGRASIVDGLARANVGITQKRDEKL